MRIFCLNFHKQVHSSIAEAFLSLTPLLQFREPGLLFGDIEQTLWLFKNSKNLLEKIQTRARDLGFTEASLALADTAAGAQALTGHFDFFICEAGQETSALAPLPVSALRDLEGFRAWEKPARLEVISEFLSSLGLKSLGDLMKLPAESWNLRWGDLGTQLQRKLASQEKSAFTPLIPDQPLVAYHHGDDPMGSQFQILESVRRRLPELLFRLEGREQALDQLSLLMICEYSGQKHHLSFSPSHKSRDLPLLMTLLGDRLQKLNFENPVREWELEIKPVSSPSRQQDFWEQQTHAQKENLQRLQSLLHDRKIRSGFLRLEEAQLPEKSWSLQNEALACLMPVTDYAFEGSSHREIPIFSEGLNTAPRPTRLLDQPQVLSAQEMKTFRFLQRYPLERFDLPWQGAARDYWLAMNSRQQCVWIYRDLLNSDYYLHGYFD